MKVLRNPMLWVFVGLGVLWTVALAYKQPPLEAEKQVPNLVYSFPPNCPEVPAGQVSLEDIDRMAGELNLQKIYEGRYYKNPVHCVFVPEQVPVLYEHRTEYQTELESYWKE